MLLAAFALVVALLILAIFIETLAGQRRAKRHISGFLAVEALEERVVPALTMQDVKARIAEAIPAIADPVTPDIVRVDLLRTWASQEVDLGSSSTRLDNSAKVDYYHRSVPQLVQLFDKDAGGVQSAGNAYFLMKLYQAYGYSSGQLTVGFQSQGSHAVTLVQVKDGNGQTVTLIEDASTDSTAVDDNGEPMSAKAVNGLARAGRGDEVYWQGGHNDGRDYLVSKKDRATALAGDAWSFDPATDSHTAAKVRSGIWKLHASARQERFESTWWDDNLAPVFARYHHDMPQVYASTFAFPLKVSGSAGLSFAHSLPGGHLPSASPQTVAELKARIAGEFPAMADPSTPDVVRVARLRTWAFEQLDHGDNSIPLDRRKDIDYTHSTILELVKLFDQDAGTVMCGGSSVFLMKLYEAYGYVAGRISVGFLPEGTHSVTLVQVKVGAGKSMILIEDAHADITPVDVHGAPLGAIQVANLARDGQADQVYWQSGNNVGRDLLVSAKGRDAALAGMSWAFNPATDSHQVKEIRPGVYKLHGSATCNRLVSMWWDRAVAPNISATRPDMPLVLASTFAFPIWVSGPAGELFAQSLPIGNMQVTITTDSTAGNN